MQKHVSFRRKMSVFSLFLLGVLTFLLTVQDSAFAKSLYVNKNLNSGSPIRAYDIQPSPNYLVFQQDSQNTRYGGAGLAIDTDSEILFVTFEGSGTFDIVDAKTLNVIGQVTAPGANNLAGVVVDQEKQKVYTINRNTKILYIYSWDAAAKKLTLDMTKTLAELYAPGSASYGAHGIALDEVNDLLYVCDVTTKVHIYRTGDWSYAGYVTVSQRAMGVAVDVKKGLVYTGNAYEPYGSTHLLSQYDLNTHAEKTVDIRYLPGGVSSDNVVGLAVDPATSLLYITTGNQGSGGSDRIIVFNSDLAMLYATGDIGDPTGIVVPGKEISFNPLDLVKDDGLSQGECLPRTSQLVYNICYDNASNNYAVSNVVLRDQLPPEEIFNSASNGGVYDSATHSVTWNLGTLPAGMQQACVQLGVKIDPSTPAGSEITNSVVIDSDQTPPTTQNRVTKICSNLPPHADAAGPYAGNEGSAVSFNGSGSSDPEGAGLIFSWTLGDGSSADSMNPIHAYADNGTYQVCLTVTDPEGLSDTACTTASIANLPPVVNAGSDTLIYSGQNFSLNAGFSDPGINDALWAITVDWGDGTGNTSYTNSMAQPITGSHQYLTPGVYTVSVTVTDKDSGSGSDSLVLTVKALPVLIDIKPGSFPNSINRRNGGNVPVGVFSGTYEGLAFDAASIDRSTVRFAGAGPLSIGKSPEDINGDGLNDIVFHFKTRDLNLGLTDTSACLSGVTTGGVFFEGCDSVRIVK